MLPSTEPDLFPPILISFLKESKCSILQHVLSVKTLNTFHIRNKLYFLCVF